MPSFNPTPSPATATPSPAGARRRSASSVREDVAVASACALLASGVVLAFIAYFRSPLGEISEGVLWFTAQCLIYAGSIFGVSVYVQSKVAEIRANLGGAS